MKTLKFVLLAYLVTAAASFGQSSGRSGIYGQASSSGPPGGTGSELQRRTGSSTLGAVTGSVTSPGGAVSLSPSALSTPTITSVTPQTAGGGKTYSYKLVSFVGILFTDASTASTTVDGEDDLSVALQGNVLVWPAQTGASSCTLYRTAAGGATTSTTGRIVTQTPCTTGYTDIGAAGDGATPPTVNISGGFGVAGSALFDGNVLLTAGKSIGSLDTGLPKFTFGTNSIIANQPITFGPGASTVPTGASIAPTGTGTITATNVKNDPSVLPTACQVGDVFMSAGSFYVNTATSAGACVWSAGQPPVLTFTSTPAWSAGGNITWDIASNPYKNLSLSAAHNTASTLIPSHLVSGGQYLVTILQDSTGTGTTTLNLSTSGTAPTCSAWYVLNASDYAVGSSVTITPTANHGDVLTFIYDGTNCWASYH